MGNGIHFCDITERASQRLFCSYKGGFPCITAETAPPGRLGAPAAAPRRGRSPRPAQTANGGLSGRFSEKEVEQSPRDPKKTWRTAKGNSPLQTKGWIRCTPLIFFAGLPSASEAGERCL